MEIRVNFFGFLKVKMNSISELASVPEGARLQDLLLYLAERHGGEFKDHVYDPLMLDVKNDILLNINDVPAHQKEGLETELREGDCVDILPLFAGGG